MKNGRPKISFPLSPFEKMLRALPVALILASIGLVVGSWNNIPDVIPIHFNLSGSIDRVGPKYYLTILIGAAAVVFFLLNFLARFPHYFNYPIVITERNALEKYKLARTLIHILNFLTTLIIFVVLVAIVLDMHSIIYPSVVIYAGLSALISMIYVSKLYKNH